jgi:hypothetical protein
MIVERQHYDDHERKQTAKSRLSGTSNPAKGFEAENFVRALNFLGRGLEYRLPAECPTRKVGVKAPLQLCFGGTK